MRICSLGSLVRSGTLAAFILAVGITATPRKDRPRLVASFDGRLSGDSAAGRVLNLLLGHPLAKRFSRRPTIKRHSPAGEVSAATRRSETGRKQARHEVEAGH